MAVIAVSTDLSAAYASGVGEVTNADAVTSFAECTGTGGTFSENYGDMKTVQEETDVFIQGTQAVSGQYTTNNAERGGIFYNSGTITVPSGGAALIWMWWLAPAALDTYANAGQFALFGSASSAFEVFGVSGNNLDPAPLGGWYCYAIDPAVATKYEDVGSPSGIAYIGGGISATKQARGLTHFAIDAIRIGRCYCLVTDGLGGNDGTFAEIVSTLEAEGSGSFGIFDSQYGAFYMQGLLQFGDNSSATGECDFADSNAVINIRNTPQVSSTFNRIEIQNDSGSTASNVSWTNCVFNNIGTQNAVAATASRGDLEVIDDTANLDITGCSFTDMGTFIFGSVSTMINTTFRRCSLITQNGATFTGCIIDASDSSIALEADDVDLITGCTFISDGTGHAVDLGVLTSNTTVTWDNALTSSTTEWDGSNQEDVTGPSGGANNAILVDIDSPYLLTVNVTGDTPNVQNLGTGDVTIASSVTLTLAVIDSAGGYITTSNARIEETDGTLIAQSAANTGANSNIFTTGYSGGSATVVVKVRDSSGGTRYLPYKASSGAATGFSITVTLAEDTIAS